MNNTRSWILGSLTVLALVFSGHATGDVAVVVSSDAATVLSGPLASGIIDDADPINHLVWSRYSPPSGTTVLLNENGVANGDGRPAVSRNPVSDLPIVAWGKNNGTGFDVVVSHFQDGAWTQPVVIAADVTTTTDPEPSIVINRQSGEVHLVYSTGESNPSVMHTRAPSDLSGWDPPALVSILAEHALRPSAAIHAGLLLVAYESHGSSVGSTPRQIVVASSDGAGGFTHESITSTHFGDPNRPELHTGMSNSLWLDWVDDTDEMAWSVWQSGAGWGAVQIESYTGLGDRDYHVRGRIKKLANQ